MLIALQVVLMIVLLLSVIGVISENESKSKQANITAVCLAAMISLVITFTVI